MKEQKIKVYHGSYTSILDIDLKLCEDCRDFGRGFYVTDNKKYAEDWAKETGRKKNRDGIVTEFIFDESVFSDHKYRTLHFETYNEEWLTFVTRNLNKDGIIPKHEFDIIKGPIAPIHINEYQKGSVSKEQLMKELNQSKVIHQICFCTTMALQTLKRTNCIS